MVAEVKRFIVKCGICGFTLEDEDGNSVVFESVAEGRIEARRQGWLYDKKVSELYCPACQKEVKEGVFDEY